MSNLVVMGRNLKKFVIERHVQRHGQGTTITVDAPNLTRLTCRHDSSQLLLRNVPNLVEASYSLYQHEDTMDHFSKAAPELEILDITLDCAMVLRVPCMRKLKKMVFTYSAEIGRFSGFLLPVTGLIHASPRLQQFTLKVINHNLYHSRKRRREYRIFEVPEVGGSPHHHLSVFEFSGFCVGAADHMALLSYVVDNCVALQEITIIPIRPIIAENPAQRYVHLLPSPCQKDKVKQKRSNREHNPYLIYPSSYDDDVVAAAYKDGVVYAKKWTEQLLACIVPHHIRVIVDIDAGLYVI